MDIPHGTLPCWKHGALLRGSWTGISALETVGGEGEGGREGACCNQRQTQTTEYNL